MSLRITRPRLRRSSSPHDDFRLTLPLYSTRRILVNINPSPGLVEGRQLKPISRLPFRFTCSCLHRPFDEQFDLLCYYSPLCFSCSQFVDRSLSPLSSYHKHQTHSSLCIHIGVVFVCHMDYCGTQSRSQLVIDHRLDLIPSLRSQDHEIYQY